ncbi:hypothetical protein [Nocardia asiatica]|uniref:helix-turn-helix domain-containing protein n=1 Tax=Nocardia asiatica TaxID=209252 RepID=UPI003EDFBE33
MAAGTGRSDAGDVIVSNESNRFTRERLALVGDAVQLGAALKELRDHAKLSLRALERAALGHPGSTAPLKKNLIEDMEKGNRIHSADDDRLELYLTLCGVSKDDLSAWRETSWRVHQADPRRSAGSPMTTSETAAGAADDQKRAWVGRDIKPPTTVTLAAVAAILAVAVTTVSMQAIESATSPGLSTPFEKPVAPSAGALDASPASTESPPLSVVDETPLQSLATDHFALPAKLVMDARTLAEFNRDVVPNSVKFAQWRTEHAATPVGRGIATLTLRNNLSESARIVRMAAIKDCGRPLSGTYFKPPAQGGAENNIKLAVNLDTTESVFQEMYSTIDGYYPAGPGYFENNTVVIPPGETQTFTIGAFTKSYSCSFRIRVFFLGSSSTLFQDVDYRGQPFRVTGGAPPLRDGFPLSGYGAAYLPAPYPSRDWTQVDPQTSGG